MPLLAVAPFMHGLDPKSHASNALLTSKKAILFIKKRKKEKKKEAILLSLGH
jgi:hypothetical protein